MGESIGGIHQVFQAVGSNPTEAALQDTPDGKIAQSVRRGHIAQWRWQTWHGFGNEHWVGGRQVTIGYAIQVGSNEQRAIMQPISVRYSREIICVLIQVRIGSESVGITTRVAHVRNHRLYKHDDLGMLRGDHDRLQVVGDAVTVAIGGQVRRRLCQQESRYLAGKPHITGPGSEH